MADISMNIMPHKKMLDKFNIIQKYVHFFK